MSNGKKKDETPQSDNSKTKEVRRTPSTSDDDERDMPDPKLRDINKQLDSGKTKKP